MSVIFDDLGINFSNMMTDPADFEEQVFKAAENLKDILKADNSVENYIKNAAQEEFDFSEGNDILNALYEYAEEEIPVGAIPAFAKKLRKLANDIEMMARDKASLEMLQTNPIDKTVAFEMYKDLRVAYNTWAEAMSTLSLYEANKLAPMPGNYGTMVSLKAPRYVFLFEGDDMVYRVHHSVVYRLTREGHNLPDLKILMDCVEYIRSHPELKVTVSEETK